MISIITVVFNGEKTIGKAIESVCLQTHLPVEYIIVDGKSTDNTLKIIKSYASRYPFIKVISEADKGIYDAMNKGLKMVSGSIVGILNSDDWYENTAFQHIHAAVAQNGSGVYYGIQRNISEEKEFFLERASHNFIAKKMIPHPATFVTSDIYRKFGLFTLNYKYSADLDLIIRFINSNVSFYPIDYILTNFRVGGASTKPQAAIESLTLRRKYRLVSRSQYLKGMMKSYFKVLFA